MRFGVGQRLSACWSGRPQVLERALSDAASEHPEHLVAVRLSGIVHTDDQQALRSVAQQVPHPPQPHTDARRRLVIVYLYLCSIREGQVQAVMSLTFRFARFSMPQELYQPPAEAHVSRPWARTRVLEVGERFVVTQRNASDFIGAALLRLWMRCIC